MGTLRQCHHCVGMLLCPRALKSRNSIKKTSEGLLVLTLMANRAQRLSHAKVPLMPETKLISPPSITSYFPLLDTFQSNALLIGGEMEHQKGNSENNKFYLHNLPNRNCEYLADFSPENSLSCQSTKFRKRKKKTMEHSLH